MNRQEVLEKLKQINYPGFSKDIVTFGFVKSVNIIGEDIEINLDITSSASEVYDTLKNDIEKLFKDENLILNINAPKEPAKSSSNGRNLAPSIKSFLMVSSGKGGVGKSTTSVNIATSLAMQGKKVGLLDTDIYGPNIPRMMGIQNEKPIITSDNKIEPIEAYGVSVMSIGNLIDANKSVVWRGAMVIKALQQLLQDVKWGELDVLVIDMPPGTGDAQLTIAQSIPVTNGLVVTTPQIVSIDDSKKSLDMFKKLNIPLAGIIENMSEFVCPSCDNKHSIFDSGTTNEVASEFNTKVVAKIPLEPAIRIGGDSGKPVVYFHPQSHSAKEYMKCANDIWDNIQKVLENNEASNEAIQPTNPAGVSACSTTSSKGGCGSSCGCN